MSDNPYLDALQDEPRSPIDAGEASMSSSGTAGNPYLTHLQERDNTVGSLVLRDAIDYSPDDAASAAKIARQRGLPSDLVQGSLSDFKQLQSVEDMQSLLKDAPITAAAMRDPKFARMTHDDVPFLTKIEKAVGGIASYVMGANGDGGMAGDIKAGVGQLMYGFGGNAYSGGASVFATSDQILQRIDDAAAFLTNTPKRDILGGPLQIEAGLTRLAKDARRDAANFAAPLADDAGNIRRGVRSGFESVGQQAPALAAGLATGSPGVGLIGAGIATYGDSYQRAREQGKDVFDSVLYAMQDTTAEVVTEKYLGLGKLIKDAGAGMGLGKMLMRDAIREVPGEVGATIWQNFNEWLNLNPEKPAGQWLEEQPDAIAQTVVATLVSAGAQTGAARVIQRGVDRITGADEQRARAEQTATLAEDIIKLGEAAKLKSRDAESFREFVDQVADEQGDAPTEFYADGEQVMNVLNQSGMSMSELEAVAPTVAKQLTNAATGTDVRVPVSELMLLGEKVTAPLVDHLRTDPESMSRADAQKWMAERGDQIKADMESAVRAQESDQAFRDSIATVRGQFLGELQAIKRFTDPVNEAYADLMANFYGSTAARLGIAPDELLRRYQVKVQSRVTDSNGNVLLQGGELGAQDGNGFVADAAVLRDAGTTEGLDEAVRLESQVDGSAARAKRLADLLKDQAAVTQENGFVGVPSLASMLSHMRRAVLDDPKVLDAVVSAIPVDVVNNLFGSEAAAKVALHDEAMLQNSPAFNADVPIAGGFRDASLPISLRIGQETRLAAELARVSLGPGGESVERDPATAAGVDKGAFSQGDSNSPRAQISLPSNFRNGPAIISLLKDADWTSFVHESGHLFLEVQADIAIQLDRRAKAGEEMTAQEVQILEDFNRLLDWFGIEGTETASGSSGGMLDQAAFHGTPHRGIEKFSTDKIGTGEGAQAYGWGLYFASRREVAEYYRNELSRDMVKFDGKLVDITELKRGPKAVALSWVQEYGSVDGAMSNLREAAMDAEDLDNDPYMPALKWLRENAGRIEPVRGQLHRVEVPEDSELLLWDRPMSEQPAAVRAAVAAALISRGFDSSQVDSQMARDVSGEVAYNAITGMGGMEQASRLLLANGVRGIKYLDGASRGKGDGSHNYVIFSGDDVAIRQTFYQGGQQPDMPPSAPNLGRTPLETWALMSMEEKTPYHEQFARGFEAFAFEGKSPSIAMQGVFQRFRSWLVQIYKSLKALNVELTDDVRDVMGRMLATDQAIEEAQAIRSLLPMVKTLEDAQAIGWSKAQFDDYHALSDRASDQAKADLSERALRDLKWMSRAKDKALKARQQEVETLRRDVRSEVRMEVMAEPVYRVWAALTTKSDEDGAIRLNAETLKTRFPEQAKLLAERRMTGADGLDPDVVAEMYGFESGEQMVKALALADKPAEAVEARTDQRMLEMFGDITSTQAIERAAQEAIHNDVRARVLATELKALEKANKVRAEGKGSLYGRSSVDVLARAAKQFGQQLVAGQRVRDIRPQQYLAAEARNAKLAEKAMAAGKFDEAAMHKRNQLVNHYAAMAAFEAQSQVKKAQDFFRRVNKGKPEDIAKARDVGIVQAMRAVLGEYGIGNKGEKARDYLSTVEAYNPDLAKNLIERVDLLSADAMPLRDLTLERLQGLTDELRSMWAMSKRARQVEIDGKLIDKAKATMELAERMEAIGVPDHVPGEGSAVTDSERRLSQVQSFWAALRRVESWVRKMDGNGTLVGPFRRYVWQPIRDAADQYRVEKAKVLRQYRDLLKTVDLGRGLIDATELGYTFGKSRGGSAKQEILHAMLHTGNDSNKRKLLLGRGWATENADKTLDTSKWDRFVKRMQDTGVLGKAEYDFLQGVWDMLESTKPKAQETHRAVFGYYFDEVTANAFDTPFGQYRGGYVPAMADPEVVKDAATRELIEQENDTLQHAFPSTAKGFTKGRTEYNRPLLLDLRMLSRHIDKVMLFSYLEQPVRDVRKILTDKEVAGPLGRIDPTAFDGLLTPWMNRVAKQQVETPVPGSNGLMRFFSVARSRAGMSAMFANISNTVQQVTGFSIAAVRVKPRHLLGAMAQWASGPAQLARTVSAASPYMATRMDNEVAQMHDAINDILLNPTLMERGQAWMQKHAYFMQAAVDNIMSPVIWTGAYNEALAGGATSEDAIRLADAVVRETQGSTLPEDVSRVETGNAFVRLFTQFASYFNMQANMLGTEFKLAADLGLRKGAGRGLYVFLMGFYAPAIVAELIAQAFRGGPGDEDDDGETLDDWLAAVFGLSAIRGATALVPVVGPAINATVNAFNSKPYDDRLGTSPAISMIESTVRSPHSVYKAIADDGRWSRAIRDTATAVSMLTGWSFLPAIAKPLGYAADVAQDKVDPVDNLDAVRGLATGVASPDSKQ